MIRSVWLLLRIGITGGSGFIGTHIANALKSKYEVVIFDHHKPEKRPTEAQLGLEEDWDWWRTKNDEAKTISPTQGKNKPPTDGNRPNHQLWEVDQTINFGKVTKPSIWGGWLSHQFWERFEFEFDFEFELAFEKATKPSTMEKRPNHQLWEAYQQFARVRACVPDRVRDRARVPET